MTKSNGNDYKIGKGKPPVHSRYKKGQSGNPSGKKKGTISLKSALENVLLQPINVKTNNELTMITMLEAIIMRMAENALKGDHKSGRLMLEHAGRSLNEGPAYDVETPEEDLEVLQRVSSDPQLLRQMTGEQGRQQDPEPSGSEEGGDD